MYKKNKLSTYEISPMTKKGVAITKIPLAMNKNSGANRIIEKNIGRVIAAHGDEIKKLSYK